MKPHHGASGTPAKFAGYQADFPGLGRGLFGLNRALDRLQRKCLDSIEHSIGFSENVWTQSSARLAPRSVRSLKQALDWLRAVCAASNKRSIGHHSQR